MCTILQFQGQSENIKIPISFVGLSNAGKTTAINRLKYNEFTPTVPTIGVSGEIIKIKSLNVQVFDLGGQMMLRSLWQPFVKTSQGTVYIFDAADPSTLDESLDWFWRVIDWTEHQGVVMFLANKIDLPHMDINEIMMRLDLSRFAKYPDLSFQIFPVSMKTGQNVENAFNWFWSKIIKRIEAEIIKIFNVHLQSTTGLPIVSIGFPAVGSSNSKATTSTEISILESSFYSAIEAMAKEALGKGSALKTIVVKNYQIVFIVRESILAAIRIGLNDSTSKARIIGDSLIDYCIAAGFSPGGLNPEKNQRLMEFLIQNFPEAIPTSQ
ncbi:MAG: ADP-ribosylation factor-like protein [Candidatus Odinarchaeota archaeon]